MAGILRTSPGISLMSSSMDGVLGWADTPCDEEGPAGCCCCWLGGGLCEEGAGCCSIVGGRSSCCSKGGGSSGSFGLGPAAGGDFLSDACFPRGERLLGLGGFAVPNDFGEVRPFSVSPASGGEPAGLMTAVAPGLSGTLFPLDLRRPGDAPLDEESELEGPGMAEELDPAPSPDITCGGMGEIAGGPAIEEPPLVGEGELELEGPDRGEDCDEYGSKVMTSC